MIETLILNNIGFIITGFISITSLLILLRKDVNTIFAKIKETREDLENKINDNTVCTRHSENLKQLNSESVDNKVFQALVIQKLEALNDKIELLITPLALSVDEIKKKLK
jgi:hypothetical protein